MRKVIVRQAKRAPEPEDERLVSLLAAGLQRLLAKTQPAVDFRAGESVTTTWPKGDDEEPEA